jgi:hypothetical protein
MMNRSVVIVLLTLAVVLSFAQALEAQNEADAQPQKVTIHVLDGRNGKPLKSQSLLVFTGISNDAVRGHAHHSETNTDRSGIGTYLVNTSETRFLQVFVNELVLCYPNPNQSSFSVSEIMSKGLVTANTCGSSVKGPTPGHLIVFARKPTFSEKMKR